MSLLREGIPQSPTEKATASLIKKIHTLAGRISQFSSSTSKLHRDGMLPFSSNADAISGGLVVGDFYYTVSGGDGIIKVVI